MISFVAEKWWSFLRKSLILVFVGVFIFCTPHVFAAMSSTNYSVQWDSIGVGATDTQTSSSYRLRSSLDAGASALGLTSSSYRLDGGYRGGVYDPVSTFRLFSQNISSQVAATALSGSTVTVTSASGFSVGDRVFLVQNEGESQLSGMGKITSIAGSDIALDALVGDSVTIDGAAGDYLYKMTSDGTTLPLGAPSASIVVTGAIGWEATADVSNGYSVYVFEDGDLRTSGSETFADVADGTVSTGSSEYGARSSDTSLSSSTFDTQDTAITSDLQLVASRSSLSFTARDYVTLKLGMDASQSSGSYSQNLTFVFSGNY